MRVLLSRCFGKVTSLRLNWFSIFVIRVFKFFLKINDPIDVENHHSLNDFFSRKKLDDLSLSKNQEFLQSSISSVMTKTVSV